MSEQAKHVVMVVDDEPTIASLVCDLARSLGCEAHAYSSAEEALRQVDGLEPFLVISDLRMRGMGGLEFCAELRKRRAAAQLPFVLLTGHADKDIAINGMSAGANELVEKPFHPEAIRQIVAKYLKARQTEEEKEARESREILEVFVTESSELLADLDDLLLRLEDPAVDPAIVDSVLRKIHSIKGGAGSVAGGKLLAELGHDFESALSKVKKGERRPDHGAIDLFLAAGDLCRRLLEQMKSAGPSDAASGAEVDGLRGQLKAWCSATGAGAPQGSAPAAAEPRAGAPARAEQATPAEEGVWVTNEQLDALMGISGEVIALKNYFDMVCSGEGEGGLEEFSQSFGKVSDRLKDQILAVRKVTLERTFSKVPRIVRQTARDVGKKVKLTLEGTEIGIDKSLGKSLSACIVHLVRNAIDHGIEAPAARASSGKAEEGSLRIACTESNGSIQILVQDDGAGVDRERVLKKAIEKRLVDPERAQGLTDEAVFDLLFLPGFSTKESVTSVSGRGVGMDVVKSELEAHEGKVQIRSVRGGGTTFALEIPLPRSVMVQKTILARDGQSLFALPLSSVSRILPRSELKISSFEGRLFCQFEHQSILLDDYRGLVAKTRGREASDLGGQSIVVLQHRGKMLGLLTDAIEGQLDAVVRPFDGFIRGIPGMVGTTVLSDKSVAFVVDPQGMIALAHGSAEGEAA